jgi:Succinylglutamate desuccinylase / Aspartoacylase family
VNVPPSLIGLIVPAVVVSGIGLRRIRSFPLSGDLSSVPQHRQSFVDRARQLRLPLITSSPMLSEASVRRPIVAPMLVVSLVVPGILSLSAASGDGTSGQDRAPFIFADRQVPAGRRMDLDVAVPAGATDPATYIPVTIFHGARSGPVLAITLGVHGYEFAPILAGQELLQRLDPTTLSGTVIMVRLAHSRLLSAASRTSIPLTGRT